MPISADTLFHFTRRRESLIGILEREFEPRLSRERFDNITAEYESQDTNNWLYLPMICFCDIPLSQVHQHMDHYGSYGIGLKKAWGMKRRVTPVKYVHANSPQATSTTNLIHLRDWLKIEERELRIRKAFWEVTRDWFYTKEYEGELVRDGVSEGLVTFYDEREWRYMPPGIDDFIDEYPTSENLHDEPKVQEYLKGLATLSFGPDDINFIIVESDAELYEMAHEIRRIKVKYTERQRETLVTKIVSAERIRTDF
jgi:hypothetical protein